jgi:MFS transporter, MHS family, proline/betaine transporter
MAGFTLIEELLLLTLEDRGGEFDRVPEAFLTCGIAGGALMELALGGRIDSDLHALWVVDPTPTGDERLDRVLADIVAEPARLDAGSWIARLSPGAPALRAAALAGLCAEGILRKEGPRYLWASEGRRFLPGGGREAKTRILELLFNDEIPDPRDIALVAMADACFVFERILSPAELKRAAPRIRQFCRMDLIGARIAQAARQLNLEFQVAERRTVLAGLAGNVLEWYDFGVYGYFAAAIGRQFFPVQDAAVSLIASFGVFAIGFLARPLGGLIFGHIGDQLGRRAAVIASVVLMVIPTCIMALLPDYARIGLAAPVLLILLRLAQGLAVGGEYTTSMVLLVEEALPSRRGRVGSFAPFGATGGLLLGSAVGATITGLVPPAAVADWGWRLAFLTGLVIGLVVLIIRRQLPRETGLVVIRPAQSPLADAFRTQKRSILKIIGLNLANGIGFYLCFVYVTTWLQQVAGVSQATALLLNSAALAALMAITPMLGALSDRIGRKPLLLAGAAGLVVFIVPLFWLMSQHALVAIFAGQLGCALLLACFGGAGPAFMVEAFPKHVRCSGLSIGYNLALSIFGGTVPMVAVFLMAATGSALSPAVYLAAAAAISAGMVLLIRADADAEAL